VPACWISADWRCAARFCPSCRPVRLGVLLLLLLLLLLVSLLVSLLVLAGFRSLQVAD
jgi:hypothetical protein